MRDMRHKIPLISKLSQISLTAREITYNNLKITLVVLMLNITTNHAINYTNPDPLTTLFLLIYAHLHSLGK